MPLMTVNGTDYPVILGQSIHQRVGVPKQTPLFLSAHSFNSED